MPVLFWAQAADKTAPGVTCSSSNTLGRFVSAVASLQPDVYMWPLDTSFMMQCMRD